MTTPQVRYFYQQWKRSLTFQDYSTCIDYPPVTSCFKPCKNHLRQTMNMPLWLDKFWLYQHVTSLSQFGNSAWSVRYAMPVRSSCNHHLSSFTSYIIILSVKWPIALPTEFHITLKIMQYLFGVHVLRQPTESISCIQIPKTCF